MILMVIDHVRDYTVDRSVIVSDPMDLTQVTPLLFLLRWLSHFCAPVSALLMGISVSLSRGHRSLALRGLILILLEFTLIDWAWNFYPPWPRKFFQVIAALGVSLLVLEPFRRLGPRPALLAGSLILLLHNLLDGVRFPPHTAAHYLWSFLHQKNVLPLFAGFEVRTTYPVLPIIAVTLFGYGISPLIQRQDRPALRRLGWLLLALFFLLRLSNLYGDMSRFAFGDTWLNTLFSLGNVTKYPLSLQYVCMTLGPALLVLAWLPGKRLPWLEVFGRAPFFFYAAHLYTAHVLALLLAVTLGFPLSSFDFAGSFGGMPIGFAIPLWATIPFALTVCAILWPACRWYTSLRQRHSWLL